MGNAGSHVRGILEINLGREVNNNEADSSGNAGDGLSGRVHQ